MRSGLAGTKNPASRGWNAFRYLAADHRYAPADKCAAFVLVRPHPPWRYCVQTPSGLAAGQIVENGLAGGGSGFEPSVPPCERVGLLGRNANAGQATRMVSNASAM